MGRSASDAISGAMGDMVGVARISSFLPVRQRLDLAVVTRNE